MGRLLDMQAVCGAHYAACPASRSSAQDNELGDLVVTTTQPVTSKGGQRVRTLRTTSPSVGRQSILDRIFSFELRRITDTRGTK